MSVSRILLLASQTKRIGDMCGTLLDEGSRDGADGVVPLGPSCSVLVPDGWMNE